MMLTTEQIKQVFIEKLQRTGDMDAAFSKAAWIAFNEGLMAGLTADHPEQHIPAVQVILDKGYNRVK